MGEARLESARRRLGLCTALLSLALLIPTFSLAQSTWTGDVNDDFSDAGNWDPGLPDTDGAATIATGTPLVGSSATVGTLGVSGGVLQINSDLAATGGAALSDMGRIEVQLGGELNSNVTMTGGSLGVSGTLNGSLDASGGIAVNDGTITGQANVNGATLTNNGTLNGLSINSGSAVTNNATGFIMLETDIINGSLTNNGSLNSVDVGAAGIFTNNMVGMAGAVTNAGTASNAGMIASLTNTGGSFVNGSGGTITGTATVSGGSVTNNFEMNAVDVMAAAMFVNNTGAVAGAVTNTGTVSNAGEIASLENTGGTFSNDFGGNITGTTTVTGGTVTNSFIVTAVDVAAAGAFINNAAGTADVVTNAGTSSNDGTIASLNNTGGTFANTGTISGRANITGGTVTNDGTISGNVAIYTGGILSGTGSVGGLTVGAGGTVSPGPGFATISVNGNIVFETGSTYQVDADPSGLSDRLAATGTVTINGGTLEIMAGGGTYAASTPYTILTGSGLSGAFDEIVTDLAFLTPDVTYGAAGITMELERNTVAFADVADTANGRATADAVESHGNGLALYDAVLALNAETANAAYRQLSGELHASLKSQAIQESRLIREAVLDRISGRASAGLPNDQEITVWTAGFGANSHIASDGNAAGIRSQSGGILAGADAAIADNTRLGGILGYGKASLNGGADTETYHAGIYGAADWDALSFTGGVIYSNNQISTDRNVGFGVFSDRLKADYDSQMGQVFGEVSTRMRAADIELRPFANLAYIYLDTDGFNEKGGAAALTSRRTFDDLTMATLGLRWSADVIAQDIPVTFSGMIGWRHALGDTTPVSRFAFASGSPFLIEGVTLPRNSAMVEAGLTAQLSKTARLKVSYSGEFARDISAHAVKANLTVDF